MPIDKSVRFDDHQHCPPIEQPAHRRHRESSRVFNAVGFDLPLLKERQLLSQKQILRGNNTLQAHLFRPIL
jgi:hypothetical protein